MGKGSKKGHRIRVQENNNRNLQTHDAGLAERFLLCTHGESACCKRPSRAIRCGKTPSGQHQ